MQLTSTVPQIRLCSHPDDGKICLIRRGTSDNNGRCRYYQVAPTSAKALSRLPIGPSEWIEMNWRRKYTQFLTLRAHSSCAQGKFRMSTLISTFSSPHHTYCGRSPNTCRSSGRYTYCHSPISSNKSPGRIRSEKG